MAFEKRQIDPRGILFLIFSLITLIASTNIDCNGRPFHCVNSTHFMICVDIGGGMSSTIDDFLLPCPQPTICHKDNRFECEFPPTTPTSHLGSIHATISEPIVTVSPNDTTALPTETTTEALIAQTINSLNPTTTNEFLHTNTATISEPIVTTGQNYSTGITTESFNEEIINTSNPTTTSEFLHITNVTTSEPFVTMDSNITIAVPTKITTEFLTEETINTLSPTTANQYLNITNVTTSEPAVTTDPNYTTVVLIEVTTESVTDETINSISTTTKNDILHVTNASNSYTIVTTEPNYTTEIATEFLTEGTPNTISPTTTNEFIHSTDATTSDSVVTMDQKFTTVVPTGISTQFFTDKTINTLSPITTNQYLNVSNMTATESEVTTDLNYTTVVLIEVATESVIDETINTISTTVGDDFIHVTSVSNSDTIVTIDPNYTTAVPTEITTDSSNEETLNSIRSTTTNELSHSTDATTNESMVIMDSKLTTIIPTEIMTQFFTEQNINTLSSITTNQYLNVTNVTASESAVTTDPNYTTVVLIEVATESVIDETINTISTTTNNDFLHVTNASNKDNIVTIDPNYTTVVQTEIATESFTEETIKTNSPTTTNEFLHSTDATISKPMVTMDPNYTTFVPTETESLIEGTINTLSVTSTNDFLHSTNVTISQPMLTMDTRFTTVVPIEITTQLFTKQTINTLSPITNNQDLNATNVTTSEPEVASETNYTTIIPTEITTELMEKTVNTLSPTTTNELLHSINENITEPIVTMGPNFSLTVPIEIRTKILTEETINTLSPTTVSQHLNNKNATTSETIVTIDRNYATAIPIELATESVTEKTINSVSPTTNNELHVKNASIIEHIVTADPNYLTVVPINGTNATVSDPIVTEDPNFTISAQEITAEVLTEEIINTFSPTTANEFLHTTNKTLTNRPVVTMVPTEKSTESLSDETFNKINPTINNEFLDTKTAAIREPIATMDPNYITDVLTEMVTEILIEETINSLSPTTTNEFVNAINMTDSDFPVIYSTILANITNNTQTEETINILNPTTINVNQQQHTTNVTTIDPQVPVDLNYATDLPTLIINASTISNEFLQASNVSSLTKDPSLIILPIITNDTWTQQTIYDVLSQPISNETSDALNATVHVPPISQESTYTTDSPSKITNGTWTGDTVTIISLTTSNKSLNISNGNVSQLITNASHTTVLPTLTVINETRMKNIPDIINYINASTKDSEITTDPKYATTLSSLPEIVENFNEKTTPYINNEIKINGILLKENIKNLDPTDTVILTYQTEKAIFSTHVPENVTELTRMKTSPLNYESERETANNVGSKIVNVSSIDNTIKFYQTEAIIFNTEKSENFIVSAPLEGTSNDIGNNLNDNKTVSTMIAFHPESIIYTDPTVLSNKNVEPDIDTTQKLQSNLPSLGDVSATSSLLGAVTINALYTAARSNDSEIKIIMHEKEILNIQRSNDIEINAEAHQTDLLNTEHIDDTTLPSETTTTANYNRNSTDVLIDKRMTLEKTQILENVTEITSEVLITSLEKDNKGETSNILISAENTTRKNIAFNPSKVIEFVIENIASSENTTAPNLNVITETVTDMNGTVTSIVHETIENNKISDSSLHIITNESSGLFTTDFILSSTYEYTAENISVQTTTLEPLFDSVTAETSFSGNTIKSDTNINNYEDDLETLSSSDNILINAAASLNIMPENTLLIITSEPAVINNSHNTQDATTIIHSDLSESNLESTQSGIFTQNKYPSLEMTNGPIYEESTPAYHMAEISFPQVGTKKVNEFPIIPKSTTKAMTTQEKLFSTNITQENKTMTQKNKKGHLTPPPVSLPENISVQVKQTTENAMILDMNMNKSVTANVETEVIFASEVIVSKCETCQSKHDAAYFSAKTSDLSKQIITDKEFSPKLPANQQVYTTESTGLSGHSKDIENSASTVAVTESLSQISTVKDNKVVSEASISTLSTEEHLPTENKVTVSTRETRESVKKTNLHYLNTALNNSLLNIRNESITNDSNKNNTKKLNYNSNNTGKQTRDIKSTTPVNNRNVSTDVHNIDINKSKNSTFNFINFDCLYHYRGRYADNEDCRKFYICVGRRHPIVGTCPVNTVFSEIWKQCTKNLSHCVRNNQFRCTSEGRFSDVLNDNVYYICIKSGMDSFYRLKLQCQVGYHLNKTSIKCTPNVEEVNQSISVDSDSSSKTSDTRSSTLISDEFEKSKTNVFECEEEGIFPDLSDCRRYYLCTKNKSQFRKRKKKCDSDEIFHKQKKKCVDADSYEC